MENLWPNDLLGQQAPSSREEIGLLLSVQANGLLERTKGLVGGIVKDRSIETSVSWSFELFSIHRQSSATPLFVVRSIEGEYPVIVESFNPDVERYQTASTPQSLREVLKDLLHATQTKRIVELLVADATRAGIMKQHSNTEAKERTSARSLLIGKMTKSDGREFCHVSLLDISGFVSAQNMNDVLIQEDLPKSAVNTLNSKYVVTIEFIGPVKFSLESSELNHLRAQIRQALDLTS